MHFSMGMAAQQNHGYDNGIEQMINCKVCKSITKLEEQMVKQMKKAVKKVARKVKKAVKKAVKPAKRRKFNESVFYQRYHHVQPGTIRMVAAGVVVNGLKVAHGRICDIACVDCGELRTINAQDAFQVKRCIKHQAIKAKNAAAKRRAKK